MIAFAAIAPHGDVDLAPELRPAMEELGRRCVAEVAIVLTPHNVHVEGHFAVVTAARVGEHETDRALAQAIIDALRADGLPVVGVSYGGNDPAEAEMPLDWGAEVPLQFVRTSRVVVVAPARDRPLEEHVRAGAALARATSAQHAALIASADHGHAHDPEGPYGFDPAAAAYDARFLELLAAQPLDFTPLAELVAAAKADSLWQLLMLQGASAGRAELLAYAAPTYYGMAVAVVHERLDRGASESLGVSLHLARTRLRLVFRSGPGWLAWAGIGATRLGGARQSSSQLPWSFPQRAESQRWRRRAPTQRSSSGAGLAQSRTPTSSAPVRRSPPEPCAPSPSRRASSEQDATAVGFPPAVSATRGIAE